jgi:serralysin
MATIIGNDNNEILTGIASELNFIDGKGGDDQIFGGSFSDTLLGGAGNDEIHGDAGDDLINSGTGNDVVFGGTGDDTISLVDGISADHKQVLGDQGDDWISAGAGVDQINGGQGIDLVDYSNSSDAVTVDLQAGTGTRGLAEGDTYLSIEDILGSGGDDVLAGNGAYNTIDGGAGNDTIRGGAGGDLLDGGDGVDVLSYTGSTAGVVVDLRTGLAIRGHAEGDTFLNFENLRGSQYGDKLSGDIGNNVLEGRQGTDKLFGNVGNDTLVGGASHDDLWGGPGADRFDFNALDESPRSARDTIRDFSQAEGDRIDLADIDANAVLAGDQAFHFVGAAATFSGVAGELRYVFNGAVATIFGDVNGDSSADLAIEVNHTPTLVASDFIL